MAVDSGHSLVCARNDIKVYWEVDHEGSQEDNVIKIRTGEFHNSAVHKNTGEHIKNNY